MTVQDLPKYIEAMENRDWQQCDILADSFKFMKDYIVEIYPTEQKKDAFVLSEDFLISRTILGNDTVKEMFKYYTIGNK